MPAEELTRSIRWSVAWQRAGRVTQGRVILQWETAVTKKSVVFVPLYTLCGKVQNCTEGLQVMYIVTKKIFVTFYHLITNNRFVTMHKL